jgi:hypothetical protein
LQVKLELTVSAAAVAAAQAQRITRLRAAKAVAGW